MKTQLFGVLRSYHGLNKVETNSSVISKGITISCRTNLCGDTHFHMMNTNSFDKWSVSCTQLPIFSQILGGFS